MGVDGGVARSTCQILVLSVGDVEVSLGVAILLGKTEIDNVDLVTSFTDTHEEVVGLDISVDERLGVNVFDSRNELIGQEKNRLQGKLSVTKVEEILQTGAEKVENHGIIVALGTKPANKRDSNATSKRLVHTSLILQLRVLGLDGLEFDGDLLTGDDIGAQIDITERT